MVILCHPDCGTADLVAFPGLLAQYFEIPVDDVDTGTVEIVVAERPLLRE